MCESRPDRQASAVDVAGEDTDQGQRHGVWGIGQRCQQLGTGRRCWNLHPRPASEVSFNCGGLEISSTMSRSVWNCVQH